MSTQTKGTDQAVIQLEPSLILADDNARFGLKQTRIDTLAESILEFGGVHTPVSVEVLTGVEGKQYRMLAGHYRLAAVSQLNEQQKAGLTLPAIVTATETPLDRLRRQLSENMDRENQSPMDQAIAIKKLKDAGIAVMEIRKIFSRPGGRKGLKVAPASNSFINMTLSFLDLPKAIQEKIHDGRVGVAAAYELTKVPVEKRASVLEAAEVDRQKQIDREESDEEKFLKAEAKKDEAVQKLEAVTSKLDEAKKTIETLNEEAKAQAKVAAEKYAAANKPLGEISIEELEKAKAERKAAEDALVETNKKLKGAIGVVKKLSEKSKSAEQMASERAKKLAEARKKKTSPASKKVAPVGPANVRKAARDQGVATSGAVPLKLKEIHEAFGEWTLPGSHAKVAKIGKIIMDVINGILTPRQGLDAVAVITGEKI